MFSPATDFSTTALIKENDSHGACDDGAHDVQLNVDELERQLWNECRTGSTWNRLKGGEIRESLFDGQLDAYEAYSFAKSFKAFVMKYRNMRGLNNALDAAKALVQKPPEALDKEAMLLNTPGGTYYLPDGMDGWRATNPEDLLTKVTAVVPSDEGMQLWLDALELFFCGDRQLIDYVQMICGLCIVGKVYVESLIIAYGDGRNGKSTFWNVIYKVLGSYSGNMSADALTMNCKRNVKPEMAELKGKRLIIAAELQEGMRLNTSVVKQ
ncbi:MAG: DNA primase, partial [Merdibacter sp.]